MGKAHQAGARKCRFSENHQGSGGEKEMSIKEKGEKAGAAKKKRGYRAVSFPVFLLGGLLCQGKE